MRKRWYDLWSRPARSDADPDQSRSGATGVVVAVVLACLAAGALGLAWQDRTVLAAEELSATTVLVLFGIVVAVGFVWLIVAIVFGRGGGPDPSASRKKKPSAVALVIQLVFVIALFAVLWRLREDMPPVDPSPADPVGVPNATATPGEPAGTPDRPAGPTWSWPVALTAGMVLALLVAAVGLLTRRGPANRADSDEEAPTATAVAQVVAAGMAALADLDEPRAAVIRSYAAMESALAQVGLPRRVADTPSELLQRAVAAGLFSATGAEAAAELARLFQRARFSRRSLPPDARLQAVAAFDRLDAELRAAARAGQ